MRPMHIDPQKIENTRAVLREATDDALATARDGWQQYAERGDIDERTRTVSRTIVGLIDDELDSRGR